MTDKRDGPGTNVPSNWFTGGAEYAAFRPSYPTQVSSFLADLAPSTGVAVDVGCGTGQLSTQLADYFGRVVGFDPSESQIAAAEPHPNIRYGVASAESLPLPDSSVDLVTAAQAAHWFNLPEFYAEARRIAAPGAVIALVSYGVLRIADADLQERFGRFYYDEIGPFWDPERRYVDEGYRTLEFPFEELDAPELSIDRDLDPEEFLGYVGTWSAVRKAEEAGRADLFQNFRADIVRIWGGNGRPRQVSWPVTVRVGQL
ncbi:class I SAM-dependent methyltransferase [uncultured Corynebacterium sp.]|uniref:class I SAM-dependent methyltransferase n=1 Tax=uncultured Corynebacterium sp. TaxID=159447 RepID=UPI0025F57111|nr:class I SAM-dependent methyltransferase [uncultured Corynebacterium sp.]